MRRPFVFPGAMAVFFAALLALDRLADERGQVLLAAATWLVLAAACRGIAAERRAQVALVVVVATCGEVLGSIVWGIYEYRLGNLPPFVPPAHGLVYLTGLRLSETPLVERHRRAFTRAVLVAVLVWALAGATVLPRLDLAGLLGAAAFVFFVVAGRAPAAYCGVFVAVAALELYGTALGTWRWAEVVPGLGIPDGNPPSGVASGYVLFDVIAMAGAAWLVSVTRRVRRRAVAVHVLRKRSLPDSVGARRAHLLHSTRHGSRTSLDTSRHMSTIADGSSAAPPPTARGSRRRRRLAAT